MTALDCHSLFSCQYPSCHSCPPSPVILDIPPSVILDISNRGSSPSVPSLFRLRSGAISWRCFLLSAAFLAAGLRIPKTKTLDPRLQTSRMTERRKDGEAAGCRSSSPRPGAHGFGSFCRNKRISPCGGETPQNPPLSLNRKRDSETVRVGPEPAREFHAPLGIHARSRGAHVGAGSP